MIVARGIVYIANDDRQRACNAIDKEFRTNERKKKKYIRIYILVIMTRRCKHYELIFRDSHSFLKRFLCLGEKNYLCFLVFTELDLSTYLEHGKSFFDTM